MPPNAVVNDGMGGGVNLDDYDYVSALDGGEAVKLVKGSQFTMKDFRLVKALGGGDMGTVFLVAERNNEAPLAMKVMKKEVLRAKDTEHRAQAEMDILASINHPLLPVLHSHFEDEKRRYLVMNYCHGGDLNNLRHLQPEKRFSENACRFYIAEVVLALEYLHKRNIAYRDLKPENILIQPDGHIMLTDFDLSLDLSGRKWTNPSVPLKGSSSPRLKSQKKASHIATFFACGSPGSLAKKPSKKSPNARVTPEDAHSGSRRLKKRETINGPANSFVGTEEYVAPEIIWGVGHGLAVDWWALGVLLFELFYGKTPFKGENRRLTFYSILCREVTFPGIPTALTDLIQKLLTKEAENRLGSKGGAEQVKNHRFFDGVNWEELEYVTRPPVVPEPFSWEAVEANLAARAKSAGKEVQTKWSFCETTESPKVEESERDNSTTTSSGRLSQKLSKSANDDIATSSGRLSQTLSKSANDDSLAEVLIAESVVNSLDSAAQPVDQSLGEDIIVSQDTFGLEARSDSFKQLPSMTPKEEVRLADDILMEQNLFDDVF